MAVELCLGSRGQTPLPENSCFIRKMPSSINFGLMVVVVEVEFVVVVGLVVLLLGVFKTSLTVV